MALSESRRKANDKYISEHYTRIALSMPNDEAAALRQYCQTRGIPVAGFIRQLVKDAISADAAQATPPEGVIEGALGVGVTPVNSREGEKG